jgi:threonine dehydrogenase-like Zn-dependent dehydrogenase
VSPQKENPHPITKESIPITFGHEFCGRILEIPAGSKLKKGDAVMVDHVISATRESQTDVLNGALKVCPEEAAASRRSSP